MRVSKRTGKRVMRKRTYRKKSAKKVTLPVKRYVKKVISRQVETKSAYVNNQITFGNINQSSTLNFAPILWYTGYHTLASGVLDGQKLGNKVTIKRVLLKYVLLPQPYDITTNPVPGPIHIQMFLGRVKQSKALLPSAGDVAMLFNQGSTTVSPTGNLTDLNGMINKDYWDMKKVWEHKLGFAAYTGSGSSAAPQYYQNNDFKYNVVRTMNITRMVQKLALFNDSANSVQNGNLFFGYQSLAASGGTTGATTVNAKINYSIHIEYEDA